MAAEAERDLGRLEELLRWAGAGDRPGISFFSVVFGVVSTLAEEGAVPELERIVMLNPLTGGIIILQGDPALLSDLLPTFSAASTGPRPASKASIEAMKTVESGEEGSDEECSVCLDGLRSDAGGMVVKKMPCGHRFHGGCIEKWLGLHGSCPLCRYLMPAEEEEPNKVGEARIESSRELIITFAFEERDEGVDDQQHQQEHQPQGQEEHEQEEQCNQEQQPQGQEEHEQEEQCSQEQQPQGQEEHEQEEQCNQEQRGTDEDGGNSMETID
ncbi:hypothetical protein Cni_G09758 [Canna indica]|uniref:RING-type domain-containing protein n=1 Tax=Canna indica TaxID=4628 RepID=A0AAQ3K310_9LILI|nr:hypothetical protein Cni_G09758 [Canna indica]